jgi:Type III secretion system lipoprotein chaperone (YscW)
MSTQEDPDARSTGKANLNGTIEFQDVTEPSSNATVHVRVQETVRVDAPAVTVAEAVIRNVDIAPGAKSTPFTVRGIPRKASARYTVRVHVDVDGSGVVSRGDYVSTQSYPFQTGSEPVVMKIAVRRVR